MKFEAVELHRLSMPLRRPFRTSFGVQTERDILLVYLLGPDGDGWGECVALAEPVLQQRVRGRSARAGL